MKYLIITIRIIGITADNEPFGGLFTIASFQMYENVLGMEINKGKDRADIRSAQVTMVRIACRSDVI